jgi:hypothetical protein
MSERGRRIDPYAIMNFGSIDLGWVTDEELIDAMPRELAGKGPFEITFQPASVFQLTALVQLAMRHPGVTGPMRETADRFLTGVRAYFADAPACLEVVRRGDDSGKDREPT